MSASFSESEWYAMYDVCNGWADLLGLTRDSVTAPMLRAELKDADQLDGLGEKWSVDIPAICSKITDENVQHVCKTIRGFWEARR